MDNESLKKLIQEYVAEHSEQFEKAALDIDAIIDETMREYDASVEEIKKSIINDPNPDTDPETEMLRRVTGLQEKLSGEIQKKLDAYLKGMSQNVVV